jgi:hypothetical protein
MPRDYTKTHHCPSCAKPFISSKHLLQHLNNKASACADWIEKNSIPRQHPRGLQQHTDLGTSSLPFDLPSERFDDPEDLGTANSDTSPHAQSPPDTSAPTTEYYPRAAHIYGPGISFMDWFSADEHADNIYYPFASRDEWEIGSFLLRSDMSMTLIDEFLKLSMVSLTHCSIILSLKDMIR